MKLAKNSIYLKVKERVKLYFIPLYVFMVLRPKYLNGRGSGCPTYRMFEPGKVLNAILYLRCTDSKGYFILCADCFYMQFLKNFQTDHTKCNNNNSFMQYK